MSATPQYITVGDNRLHYRQWGSGLAVLLAFHGYGNDASLFDVLQPQLSTHYTVLSFDLPHHGQSIWQDEGKLTRADLAALVQQIIQQYKIDKVSLTGYSMGGRICLGIIDAIPGSIDKVALLATDGLTINPWYYMATHMGLGKRLFRHLVEKPDVYFRIMQLLERIKVVPATRYKFAMHYLKSAASRKNLWRRWMSISEIVPAPARVKKLIAQYRIQVHIFMGRDDKILPPSLARSFASGIDTVHLHVLDKGHRVLDSHSAPQIASSLL